MHQHIHEDDRDHDHHHHDHGEGHGHHHDEGHGHPHHHHGPPPRRRGWLGWAVAALGVLGAVALVRSAVIVDETEAVYITEFGRPVRLIERPGLYAKWPHQSRRGFDMRLRLDSPPPREMLTRDKKNLEVAWSVSWRIVRGTEGVDRFLRAMRTPEDASARLEDLAASVLAAELGGRDLADLVRVDDRPALGDLMESVTDRVGKAAGDYGVEVVDVRLRRLNYPEEVRTAVFEQIRSERKRVAAATRAEGESQARTIRSAADLERAKVLAEAEADAARLVGEGEAQAVRIANEAHAADPDFYRFLKTLETYRAALDARTTLVLSAESAFLRLLTQGVPEPAAGRPGVARGEGAAVTTSAARPAVAAGSDAGAESDPDSDSEGGR